MGPQIFSSAIHSLGLEKKRPCGLEGEKKRSFFYYFYQSQPTCVYISQLLDLCAKSLFVGGFRDVSWILVHVLSVKYRMDISRFVSDRMKLCSILWYKNFLSSAVSGSEVRDQKFCFSKVSENTFKIFVSFIKYFSGFKPEFSFLNCFKSFKLKYHL